MTGPLEGITVLDLTQVQSGPSCTQMLAWLGADVIKIEEPGVGDRSRRETADRPDVDSFYFLVLNANKRSVELDLRSDKGRDIFLRLVRSSDVVVENLAPGGMERLGLTFDEVREANPGIVYASIKGFGAEGPYAGYKSFENVAQATGGAMSPAGEPDGPPVVTPASVADYGSGLHCAIGILAALRHRDRTGEGQRVEVSMQDSVASFMRVRVAETLTTGAPVARMGRRLGGEPSVVYPCRPGGTDDYVSISIGGEAWDSLLALAGRPDLIGDERYATAEARSQHSDEVEAIVSEWTARHTKREIMATVAEIGIPCGAVLSTAEVLEDPHLRSREMVLEVDDPERGEYRALGCPVRLGSHEVEWKPPPVLGEHTEQVLSAALGLNDTELHALRADGVI